MPTIEDFQALQLRVGTVLTAEAHEGTRRQIGELGLEVLILGAVTDAGVVLLGSDTEVAPGSEVA